MPPAQTGGRSSVGPDPGARVVTRARAVPDVSVRALLTSQEPPRLHWADRDGLELTGVGAAVRLTAAGQDRFDSIREAAITLFEDVDHEGPPATRPRLFGGFAFDGPSGFDDAGGSDEGGATPGDGAETRDDGAGTRDDGVFSDDGARQRRGRADRSARDVWSSFPSALFVLPRLQLTRDDGRAWLSATAVGEAVTPEFVESQLDEAVEAVRSESERWAGEQPPTETPATEPAPTPTRTSPGVRWTTIQPDREAWTDAVGRTIERIATGELQKLVLATSMDVELEAAVDVPSLLDRFRATYPECYRFLVQPTDDAAFVGPPPERLLKLTDGEVRTEGLAGSIARGETPAEDDARARSLRDDDKRQHEQQLVVDAIRDELSRFGDVTEHEQTVRRLETIQHLRTPITAGIDDSVHVLSLVEALHPTPAVGGLPRETALRTIRETESFDRGWYASPVGWIDADGDGEFTVAIRSGVVDGDRATLFAGNGIVADSDPDAEWAEIKPKFRPLLDELQ